MVGARDRGFSGSACRLFGEFRRTPGASVSRPSSGGALAESDVITAGGGGRGRTPDCRITSTILLPLNQPHRVESSRVGRLTGSAARRGGVGL